MFLFECLSSLPYFIYVLLAGMIIEDLFPEYFRTISSAITCYFLSSAAVGLMMYNSDVRPMMNVSNVDASANDIF